MSSAVSVEFKELVRSRTDLVGLVSESLALVPQSGGNVFKGLCPWHDDRSPSLCVYPDRQSWRCWVCNDGGDCYSWVMKREGLNFPEAIELLAQRIHLEIPKNARSQGGNRSSTAPLYEVLAWAEQEFVNALHRGPEGKRARDYLHSRGFTAETIEKFRIGFHPPQWDWLIRKGQGKFTHDQMYAAKLIRPRTEGQGYRDEFIDRVMFPIRDERSRVVAFGGRILPDHPHPEAPKYFNSPESPVFIKSRILYGLDAARHHISQAQTAVVMEGYTDCIMTHQAGIPLAVATLGTAMTELHVSLLKRFSRKVVLIYDGDEPGLKAADRSVGKFLHQDVDLRILTLPQQLDPADYLSQQGADALRELIDAAPEAWEFKFNRLVLQYGIDGVDSRQRIAQEMSSLLASVPRLANEIREDLILARLADRLRIPESRLRIQLDQLRKKSPATEQKSSVRIDGPQSATQKQEIEEGPQFRLECDLLEVILAAQEPLPLMKMLNEIDPADFQHAVLKEIYRICIECAEHDIPPTYERITTITEEPELKKWAAYLDETARRKGIPQRLNESTSANELEREMPEYLRHVLSGWHKLQEQRQHDRTLMEYTRSTAEANDGERAQALLKQAMEYHQRRATRNNRGGS